LRVVRFLGVTPNYYPDFIVKQGPADIWIIETKGREDLDDPLKRERLRQWCDDASQRDPLVRYRSMFVGEEGWTEYRPDSFAEFSRTFASELEPAT